MAAFDDSGTTFGTYEDRAVWLMELLLADFPAWDVDAAAADAGNAGAESELRVVEQVGGGGGYGPWQWSGPRRAQYETYCTRTGRIIASLKSAYDFHFVELKGSYSNVVALVAAAKSLPDKVTAFEQHYEMAGIVRMDARNQFAQRAKAAYLAKHPVTTAPAPTTTPAPTKPAPPVPITTKPPPPPTTTPAPTKGLTSMFNIASLIGLITQAPSIIQGTMTLITEIEAGYAQGKAAGGDPIVIFEDILAQLSANKGAIATAVLGPEPVVTTSGAPVDPSAKKV